MGRRGFFAELQYQSRVAARERERNHREAIRTHIAALRLAEQTRKNEERLSAQLARAAQAERKRLEKEAREAHLEAMEAEAAARNAKLQETFEDLDSLLLSTVGKDDYVDLRALRTAASHPEFDRPDLEVPTPQPRLIPKPPEPSLNLPPEPSGLFGFLQQKSYQRKVEEARRAHAEATNKWQAGCEEVAARSRGLAEEHAQQERRRIELLAAERERYLRECRAREGEAEAQNKKLETLIANLGYGVPGAIQEYVSIVLANSVYTEHFPVEHDFSFDPATAELRLSVLVPGPDRVPDIKSYKYNKSKDEIVTSSLSQKECRDRYASAIHQVALRSFHEVFEADRQGLIKTISLEVYTNAIDPATGRPTSVKFVVAAAERNEFLSLDLAAVVPALTLERMGAEVSKNPYGLAPAPAAGVRRS